MERVMKAWCAMAILFAGLGFFAHADDLSEAEAINSLSQQCGNDVLCYFSKDSVAEALGDNANELVGRGLFNLDDEDLYMDEEEGLSDDAVELLNINLRTRKAVGANTNTSSHTRAPIWGSFINNFRKCAQGCLPANLITFGSRSNYSPTAGVGNYTCHAEGRAIDVGAIVCKGKTYRAIDNGRFATFVACMKPKMKTLWHQGRQKGVTRGHYDHAHFSNGCVAADGNRWI
jgi:hypothetical protein